MTPLNRQLLCIMACFWLTAGELRAVDLSDPAQAMETWIRLKGDTGGEVTYEWMTGTAYGVPDNESSRALFHIESVTVRQTKRRARHRV